MVPQVGLEPTLPKERRFECRASASFTTGAWRKDRGSNPPPFRGYRFSRPGWPAASLPSKIDGGKRWS
jgi:hypothetical protein